MFHILWYCCAPLSHTTHNTTQRLHMLDWARTTLGLKGGSTSLRSSSCQLMLLKKGCKRMLPTIPSLRVGSLSNSCQEIRLPLKTQYGQKERERGSTCCGADPLQQVLGLLVDPARIMGRVHADGLKQLVLVVPVERRLTDQHLVQQDSKGPPVHGEGVLLAQQDLGPKSSLTSETHRHTQQLKGTSAGLPRGRCSPEFRRTWWPGSPQTRSPCTCRSRRSLCDPRDPT